MIVDFLGSNLAIGLVLIGLLAWAVIRGRAALTVPLRAAQPGWRLVARVAYVATAALVLWGTLVGNWRKLVSEALDINEQFHSQRLVQDRIPAAVLVVTLALLAVSLLTVAPLLARYVGGYPLQFALIIAAITAFIPVFALRQRLDTALATIDVLPSLVSLDMAVTALFIAGDYLANVALLLVCYLGLLGLVAIPVTVVLDLRRDREPPPDTTQTDFFVRVHEAVVARRAVAAQQHRNE